MPLLDVWGVTVFDNDLGVYLDPDNLPYGDYVLVDRDGLQERGAEA